MWTLVKVNANNAEDRAEKAWGTAAHHAVLKLAAFEAAFKMNMAPEPSWSLDLCKDKLQGRVLVSNPPPPIRGIQEVS